MRLPLELRTIRIVAVSPGDVAAEREQLAAVVDELNRSVAPSEDVG